MCVLTSVNFENFASFLANYQKVIHNKICQNSWITKVHVKASALCLEKTRENKEWPKITDQNTRNEMRKKQLVKDIFLKTL